MNFYTAALSHFFSLSFPLSLSLHLIPASLSLSLSHHSMDVYNADLLQYIRPDTILSWTRARLSNQLASTGAEWAEVFSMYHSGTCTLRTVLTNLYVI
jgi:hypothetical protein